MESLSKSRLLVACKGEGVGRDHQGQEELLDALDVFTMLIVVMVSWVYTDVKTYEIIHYNYVYFIVSTLK